MATSKAVTRLNIFLFEKLQPCIRVTETLMLRLWDRQRPLFLKTNALRLLLCMIAADLLILTACGGNAGNSTPNGGGGPAVDTITMTFTVCIDGRHELIVERKWGDNDFGFQRRSQPQRCNLFWRSDDHYSAPGINHIIRWRNRMKKTVRTVRLFGWLVACLYLLASNISAQTNLEECPKIQGGCLKPGLSPDVLSICQWRDKDGPFNLTKDQIQQIIDSKISAPNETRIERVACIAFKEGVRGESLAEAIAIAQGESGLLVNCVSPNRNGTLDYGLWQMNNSHRRLFFDYGQGNPDQVEPNAVACALQPYCNAEYTHTLWEYGGDGKGGLPNAFNHTKWHSMERSEYKKALDDARQFLKKDSVYCRELKGEDCASAIHHLNCRYGNENIKRLQARTEGRRKEKTPYLVAWKNSAKGQKVSSHAPKSHTARKVAVGGVVVAGALVGGVLAAERLKNNSSGACISTRNCIVSIFWGRCICSQSTADGPCNFSGTVAQAGQSCGGSVPCAQGLSCNNGVCEGPKGRFPF